MNSWKKTVSKALVFLGVGAVALTAYKSQATLYRVNQGKIIAPSTGPGYAGQKNLVLDGTKSHLSFHVIKDDAVTVRGKMSAKGTFSKTGELKLTVDLASLDTQLEPRDVNIKNTFFEVAKPQFAKAEVTITLTKETMAEIKKKEPFVQEVTGSLMLHGTKANFTAKTFISPGKNGGFRAISAQPVEVHIDTWGLGANLAALMKVCGHRNVAKPAQVTYDLSFQ